MIVHLKKKKFFFIDEELTGENSNSKIKRLMDNINYDTLIINSSESVCWLLNIRGFDLPFTPVVQSRMIISNLM